MVKNSIPGRLIGVHCEGPGVADWFKESTITTRSLYSFNLLKCSYCSLDRSLSLDCGGIHPVMLMVDYNSNMD
ncbi:hypothetical protein CesoFtcFv8_017317 [Champsocephalus esox]|uniref:Uncharacterized protein n=2 Tax=Champsocephalus TaxID=52236 RepID=A0AAN8D7D3_CHAGU|nr:hypothetical protein CesoFtcFv8_017317 [Champsocephalus esox]KAK5916757.1 hypothetical protein CgunFtcFv8_011707 [Champsocephalus gunnari]